MKLKKMERILTMRKILKVLVLTIGLLCLVGCNQSKPEQAVSDMFNAMKNTDIEKLSAILGSETQEIAEEDAFLQLIKKSNQTLSYTIKESTIEGNKAKVVVDCTYGDLKPVIGDAMKNYMKNLFSVAFSGEQPTDEEVDAMLQECINNSLTSIQTQQCSSKVTIDCIKKDGVWVIDNTKENVPLADVFTGNMVSTFTELSDTISNIQE